MIWQTTYFFLHISIRHNYIKVIIFYTKFPKHMDFSYYFFGFSFISKSIKNSSESLQPFNCKFFSDENEPYMYYKYIF